MKLDTLKAAQAEAAEDVKNLEEALDAARRFHNIILHLIAAANANAKPPAAAPQKAQETRTPKTRFTAFKRQRGVKAYRYIHGNVSYYDVAVNLIKTLGRPVTNYEVYRELCKVTGKNLPKGKTLQRIYGCLMHQMDRTHPIPGEKTIAWNVRTAAELENAPELTAVTASQEA